MKFFGNQKKKIIFIEGPSWAFYSFIFVLFFKCLKSNFLVIYRSHSIEYEIRKKNSSNFLSLLTFFFEKKFYNYLIYAQVFQLLKKKISIIIIK